MLPVWSLLLAWLIARWRRPPGDLGGYIRIVALGLGIHILGDWITGWGTLLFAPLSGQAYSLNTTFIIDPVITALLGLGLLAGRYLRPAARAAQLALLAVALYVGLQAYLQREAMSVAREYAEREAPGASVHVFPQPFSPAHWRLLVETAHAYHEADLDLWAARAREPVPPDALLWRRIASSYQPEHRLRWRRIARYGADDTAAFARAAWGADEFAAFRRFAVFPALYRVVHDGRENCAYFYDLRFNLNGRTPPFRFGACRQGGDWQLRPYSLE
jgi:inner membrane protein